MPSVCAPGVMVEKLCQCGEHAAASGSVLGIRGENLAFLYWISCRILHNV